MIIKAGSGIKVAYNYGNIKKGEKKNETARSIFFNPLHLFRYLGKSHSGKFNQQILV
jgi:hypothetical protein